MSAPCLIQHPPACSPFPEILLSAGGVTLPPAGRAHPEESAAGGREETPGSWGQHHHSHPCGSGGLLRAHLQPPTWAGGRRWGCQSQKPILYRLYFINNAEVWCELVSSVPWQHYCFLVSVMVMPNVDPASRRSGEPGITPSVRQPILRLQQLPQELLFPPGLCVVCPLIG